MTAEDHSALAARAAQVDDELAGLYPDAHCALDHDGPFQLLVATVLSAQTTDKRVNTVTPGLFQTYPDAAALAGADRADLEERLRPDQGTNPFSHFCSRFIGEGDG